MSVIEADFGRSARESARKFARLSRLIEEREADILRDPVKYLDLASAEILRLRRAMEYSLSALDPPPVTWDAEAAVQPLRTVVVVRDDWERMRECVRRLQADIQ